MAGDDPRATDKAVVASLPPSVRSCLKPEYRTRYASVGGCDATLLRYKLERPLTGEEAARCREIARVALAPASPQEVLSLLTRLKLMTASAAQNQQDIAAQMACYADELMKYPADVVRSVLQSQPRASTFWPAWAEISARLSMREDRRLLFKALGI